MEKTAKQELVRRCADLMGREQLAARLGISTALLDAWIRGEITMPNGQLLPLATSLNQLAGKESLDKELPVLPSGVSTIVKDG